MKRSIAFLTIVLAFAGVLTLAGAPAAAQVVVPTVAPTPEAVARCATIGAETSRNGCIAAFSVRPLDFPAEAEPIGREPQLKMAIHRPPGDGPFPAIVLLQTCTALGPQLLDWTKSALRRGYVVFLIDSFLPRGIKDFCSPSPGQPAPHLFRLRDAYEALDHLAQFDFVDMRRVAAMGFSQGGRVVYMLASKGSVRVYSPSNRRFAALVSLYGECFNHSSKLVFLRPDTDVPLLSLLGERDEDGDPRECVPRLQAAKEADGPVEWHVFPGAGHSWDDPKFNPSRRLPYYASPSGTVLHAYDAGVTAESERRAFEFLDQRLKR